MGTKLGSKYGKTQGKVKNYQPILGAAEGRPHKGRYFFTSPCVFPYLDPILVPIVGISVNSLYPGGYSGCCRGLGFRVSWQEQTPQPQYYKKEGVVV